MIPLVFGLAALAKTAALAVALPRAVSAAKAFLTAPAPTKPHQDRAHASFCETRDRYIVFTYDTFLPRPLSMTDGQGTTTYTYGAMGGPGANRLATINGPHGDLVTLQYDGVGRLSGRTVNGASETQSFDALWRTSSTTNALDTFELTYLGQTGQVTVVNSTQGPLMQYAYGTNQADRRLAQIKNLGRGGNLLSQFDFTTNAEAQIKRIVESHGLAGTPTPTPTPTNTTTPTPTPTPTATPPCDDDDHHHHGNHHGKGHQHHGKGKGKGHDKCDDDKPGKKKHGGVAYLPGGGPNFPDNPRPGTTAFFLTLWGALALYGLSQRGNRQGLSSRRGLASRLTCLGLAGSLALNGCLVGNVNVGAGTTVTWDFEYDLLGQLAGVKLNETPAATFDFDASGNLISLTAGNTTTTFTANSLNQRTSPGVNVYDAKGQTKDQNGRQFEWDDDGRLTAIIMDTHRSEFQYDGYGRRVRITEKESNVVESDKLYFWLGGEIVCERDALQPGNPVVKRYFGQGVIADGQKLYYTFDQLGSVRELVDATGEVRADYRYSVYGERTKIAGDLESDWGWAGLWHHEPSGLDLATYRAYDPTMGRWLSRDPLGEGVDYNLYRYCGNDPVGWRDPDGLVPISPGANPIRAGADIAVGGAEMFLGAAASQAVPVAPDPGDVAGAIAVTDGAKRVRRGLIGLGIWASLQKGDGGPLGKGPKPFKLPKIEDIPDPVDPPKPPPEPPGPGGSGPRRPKCRLVANLKMGGGCRYGSTLERFCVYSCDDGTTRVVKKGAEEFCSRAFEPLF